MPYVSDAVRRSHGDLAKENFMGSEIRKFIGLAVGAGAFTLTGIVVAIILAIFYDSLLVIWSPLIISVGFVFVYLLLAPLKYK